MSSVEGVSWEAVYVLCNDIISITNEQNTLTNQETNHQHTVSLNLRVCMQKASRMGNIYVKRRGSIFFQQ